MADFDTLSSSEQDSSPVLLFRFAIGSEAYLYTSSADTITIGADDYVPEAIQVSGVRRRIGDRNHEVSVTVPVSNDVARMYLREFPPLNGQLTVLEIERDETPSITTLALWIGRILSSSVVGDGHAIEINTRTIEAARNGAVPRYTYQRQCNHRLYDSQCGVNPDLFKHTGLVTAVDARSLLVVGADGFTDSWFRGGYATFGSEHRLVTAHAGTALSLSLPFTDSPLGNNLDLHRGCDHVLSGDCLGVFTNPARNGGFPFGPNLDPFQKKWIQ